MNLFAIIILSAILLEFVLNLVADILNLKALKLEPPSTLQDVYKPEAYRRSQEYLRLNTLFGFIVSTFSLIVLLAFWFAGGFNFLDQIVRGWGFGSIIAGLLYTGILLLAYGLVALPFSIYDTFVIEERFGFNRTTPRIFVLDRLKGLALAIILGTPLMAWSWPSSNTQAHTPGCTAGRRLHCIPWRSSSSRPHGLCRCSTSSLQWSRVNSGNPSLIMPAR